MNDLRCAVLEKVLQAVERIGFGAARAMGSADVAEAIGRTVLKGQRMPGETELRARERDTDGIRLT